MSEFDWYADDIVVKAQPATAVYFNPDGAIVIRQRDEFGDEDPYVYLQPDAARRVVAAILELLDEDQPSAPAQHGAKDRTAAERQRRYRERRNGRDGGERNVTVDRDAVTPVTRDGAVTPLPLLARAVP